MRNRNLLLIFTVFFLFALSLAACDGSSSGCGSSSSSSTSSSTTSSSTSSSSTSSTSSGGSDADADISLNGNSISVSGTGVTASGTVATITSAGTFTISGTLNNGQIVVDTDSSETVNIILNGADIHNNSSSPFNIVSAEEVVLELAAGTKNYLSDGSSYASEDEPDATLFSKEDLTITGSGSLSIDANYNNGIKSKDRLLIESGTITVDSVDDAIVGKDYIAVRGGNMTVKASGDGLKSTEDEDTEKGYISIEGGQLNITAGADGLQAETNIYISGGSGTITTGGGSSASIGADDSAKGLKASVGVTIDGGNFTINSADDTINTNDSVVINAGTLVLSTGDDAIHADYSVTINGGDVTVSKSYEGIESRALVINDGTIRVTSSDDGLNAVDPDSTGGWDWDPNQNSGNCTLAINGGYLAVNANGDGIDINGTITMTDGVVIVNGPTANDNGALDHSSFRMTGGLLVAVGSSGMAQAPSTTSTQYSLLLNFSSTQTANQLIHIQNSSGTDILTFAPAKRYQSLAFSSSGLKYGSSYSVYLGGKSTGTVEDGLYSGGTYSGGSQYTTFTISSIVTTIR